MSEIKRELRERHIRALLMIARSGDGCVTRARLVDAIGGYAANTIKSLEERQLIRPTIIGDRPVFALTPAGRELARELLQERAS